MDYCSPFCRESGGQTEIVEETDYLNPFQTGVRISYWVETAFGWPVSCSSPVRKV